VKTRAGDHPSSAWRRANVLHLSRRGLGSPSSIERVVRKRCAFCGELTANRPNDRFSWAVLCSEQCLTSYDEWFSEWVAQGRLAQGLPPKLDDPAVLARIARIIELQREYLEGESAVLRCGGGFPPRQRKCRSSWASRFE